MKKKYIKIRKNKTIMVYTPVPYVVDAYKDLPDEQLNETAYELHQSCMFLWNCLKLLDISKKEAIEKNYTLNKQTGDALRNIAIHHNHDVSHEFVMTIANHDW